MAALPEIAWRQAHGADPGSDADAADLLFRATFEQANVGIAHTSLDGRFLRVNRKFCDILGRDGAELIGRTFASVTHSPDLDSSLARLRDLADGIESAVTFQKRYVRSDGTLVWVELHISIVCPQAGMPGFYIVICKDVSDERRARQLAELEHAVTRVIAEAPHAEGAVHHVIRAVCASEGWTGGQLWVCDEEAGVLRAGESWASDAAVDALLRASRDATIARGAGLAGAAWASGRPCWVSDVRRDASLLRVHGVVDAGVRGAFHLPVGAGERTLGVLSFLAPAAVAADASLLEVSISIGRQVGEFLLRQRAEEELRRSELRFRSLTELSSDWYWEQDRHGRFVSMAASLKACMGLDQVDVIGRTRWELPGTCPSDIDRALLDAAFYARRPFRNLGYEIVGGDGERHYVESSGMPVFDADGQFCGYRGIGRDVTEARRAAAALQASERFNRMTVDALWSSLCVLDEQGFIVAVNHAWRVFAEANGGQASRLLEGSNYLAVCDSATGPEADEARAFAAGVRAVLSGSERVFTMEYACHSPMRKRWFLARVTGFAEDGPTRAVVTHEDITARVLAEEAIRLHARRQQLVSEFGIRALATADPDELQHSAVSYVNRGLDTEFGGVYRMAPDARALTLKTGAGWDDGWIGRSIPDLDARTPEWHAVAAGEPVVVRDFATELRYQPSPPVAAQRLSSALLVPVIDSHVTYGLIAAYSRDQRDFSPEEVSFLRSIAHVLGAALGRRIAEERMAELSQFDHMTGLPNRNLLLDRLAQTLVQARRGHRRAAVLCVNVDHFKNVNDALGHDAGDCLLREIGARLNRCVRSGDTVGRLGGDGFAIVLADLAKPDDAAAVAQKIIDTCGQPFEVDGSACHVTASVGIALFAEDGDSNRKLLKNADIAMYRAKELGRGRYQFFLPQMHEQAVKRMQIESELRGALARGEWALHYQPKAALDTGEIDGFEALLRWNHSQRGLVPPGEFIGVLEETGLIAPVGEWVIRTACRQIAEWKAAGLPVRPVAVNVSARQFQTTDLDGLVGEVLQETRIDPGLLELELTESVLMGNPDQAVRMLRALKARGVRLSVDDFGTGYSSLAYLKRFPLDALKIDRAFIRDCIDNPDDATIALTVIKLAHSLNLKVIAEGVETEAQACFLRSHGCDTMQGYLFSRPQPHIECGRLLTQGARLILPLDVESTSGPAVLIVDDDEDDRLFLRRALEPAGYTVLEAGMPNAAFETMARQRIDIVISDHRMPGMTGVQLLAGVRRLYPEAVRILMSGAEDPGVISDGVNQAGIRKFLSKNADAAAVRAAVREAQVALRDGDR